MMKFDEKIGLKYYLLRYSSNCDISIKCAIGVLYWITKTTLMLYKVQYTAIIKKRFFYFGEEGKCIQV